jgi:DNA anti-recombination protein RmuC
MMENKEAYRKKIEAQLDEWKAQAEKLKAQMRKKQAETEIDYSDTLDELDKRQDYAKSKLSELKKSSGDAWTDIQKGMEEAAESLKNSIQKARTKFN